MIVYHGGTEIIQKPDIKFSKKYLDFGCGFYTTTYKEQAEKWAKRRAMRNKSKAVVNIYDLSEDLIGYKIMNFKEDDALWKWNTFMRCNNKPNGSTLFCH